VHHTILGGKVHVYKRPNSSSWQCATYLAGRNRRTTTKEDSLSKAKEFAEDWYLQLRGKLRVGELKTGKLFRDAAKLYLREFDIMTQGQRSAKYVGQPHDLGQPRAETRSLRHCGLEARLSRSHRTVQARSAHHDDRLAQLS
jgi:hypothetical protein